MPGTRKVSSILTGLALLLQTSLPQLACSTKPPAVADRRCDELADSPYDSQKVGSGVPFAQINISEALPVCEQAATRQPPRPRYQFIYGRVLEAANRYADAAQAYSLAEQAGYALAAVNLGRLYTMGRGVSQDFQHAARLYRQGADAGVSVAFYNLGQLYETGQGVSQDWGEAAKWYQKAGDAGYADGYAALSVLHAQSNPPHNAEAAKWAQKAAQGGSAFGSLLLGWHYLSGAGIEKDPVLAKRWYEEAAKQGLTDAMYRLGLMYRTGEGIPPDPGTAAQWMYKAAEQGHHLAEAELGNMFYNGRGTKQDYGAAFAWYLRAAQGGIVRAQNSVAALYELGQGVTKNDFDAVAWYRKAADQGDVYAMDQMGMHLRLGKGVAWNEAEAMQWFRKAADKGYAPAESSLGYGYMHGLGGGLQDYRQSAYWLGKAAAQGDSYGQYNLAVLYGKGWGVDQDLGHAKALFLQAAGSPVPELAKNAREMAMAIETPSHKTPDWVPVVAIGGGIAALAYLLSGPSSRDAKDSSLKTLEKVLGNDDYEKEADRILKNTAR